MTRKEINTVLAKPLASAAGIIGLLQGLAWTIFSVLSICCHTRAINVNLDTWTNNDTDYFKHIFKIFLNPDDFSNEISLQVKPREFYIFMWFYVVFSVFWTIVSGTVIWAMIHNQWHLVKYILGSWSTITVLISIVDVVLLTLIAIDYKRLSDLLSDQLDTDLVTYGIMMTIVARGYLLWVVNVIFAITMAILVYQAVQQENHDTTGPIINGYDTANSNPPWFGTADNTDDLITSSPKDYHRPYQENHGFERSQSFFNADVTPSTNRGENDYVDLYNSPYNNGSSTSRPNQEEIPNTSFATAIANKVATIGKNKGRRSPINAVPAPVIPPPDYTPPGSPRIKSVLRSNSKYFNVS